MIHPLFLSRKCATWLTLGDQGFAHMPPGYRACMTILISRLLLVPLAASFFIRTLFLDWWYIYVLVTIFYENGNSMRAGPLLCLFPCPKNVEWCPEWYRFQINAIVWMYESASIVSFMNIFLLICLSFMHFKMIIL